MQKTPDDGTGPTKERINQAGGWYDPKKNNDQFFTVTGQAKSTRRFNMADDALGKALKRRFISAGEYAALNKYALHWLAGGLQGHLGSVDLNRILAFDPGSMNGLAKTERQCDHRALYWRARLEIGTRPAFVADQVACYDVPVRDVALMLGYASPYRGREEAKRILSDAGYRLAKLWDELAKGN